MRKLFRFLFFGVLVAVGVNALIESQRECGCYEDCWCKQPGLRHFRWLIPVGHRGPWLEA